MRGRTVVGAAVATLFFLAGELCAETAVPVSPSGTGDQVCPTFSWSAVEGARRYRVEVYERVTEDLMEREAMMLMASPVVLREIRAPALSWSASTGDCLARGLGYVWYVRGEDGEGSGEWSEGRVFELESSALSVAQAEEVRELVRRELEVTGGSGVSFSDAKVSERTVSGLGAIAGKTASVVPLALPPTIAAYGNAYETVLGDGAGASLNLASPRYDTFIGAGAGFSNTTGNSNTFVGRNAGYSNTTGSQNTFVGMSAGLQNETGGTNEFVGLGAGASNTDGYSNVFVGSFAGSSNMTGHWNVFVGHEAGHSNITGINSVYLGNAAGYSETGSNRLYIDNCYTGTTAATGGPCTQPLIYGEFDNRIVRVDGRLEIVTVATPSDIRYKKEVHGLATPLAKVLKLEGVTYEWDREKVTGAGFEDGRQIGLIAQEVEKVLPELVHTDNRGYKTVSYDKLGPVLVEAVKEQQREIVDRDASIERLETVLKDQDAVITALKEELQKIRDEQNYAMASILARLASLESPVGKVALK